MSIVKRRGSEYAEDYEELETELYKLQDRCVQEKLTQWMVPQCPKCQGVLSNVCMSRLLVCLKCDTEYKVEVKT
jgi:hypothetical protein